MRARKSFDTLQYANQLKEAGIESKAAEALAEGQAAANEAIMTSLLGSEGLATKADLVLVESKLEMTITSVESRLDAKIAAVENKLDARITAVENKLDARITAVETNLDAKITAVETNLDARITAVETNLSHQIVNLENKLTLKIGGIVLAALTILAAFNHFIH
ncbi:MAG: hypothetical protein SFW66_03480 [Gammaproteobacteria bacterium]|nr:hypothetical protein [Gammaproteobacteria bacterium]